MVDVIEEQSQSFLLLLLCSLCGFSLASVASLVLEEVDLHDGQKWKEKPSHSLLKKLKKIKMKQESGLILPRVLG